MDRIGYHTLDMEDDLLLEPIPEDEREEDEDEVQERSQEEVVEDPEDTNTRDEEVDTGIWKKWYRNTMLLQAVLKSDLQQVKRLLSEGASPMCRCQQSMVSVCHLAALRGEEQILTTLLDECRQRGLGSTGVRGRDRKGRQPHHLAAAAGSIGTLQILLKEDPGVVDSQVLAGCQDEVPEADMDTILHNHSEISIYDVEIPEGSTALHAAFRYDRYNVVQFLINENVDVSIVDGAGLNPAGVAGTARPGVSVSTSPRHFEGHLTPSSASSTSPLIVKPMSRLFRIGQNEANKSTEREAFDVALDILNSQRSLGTDTARVSSILHKHIEKSTDQKIEAFITKCKDKSPDLLLLYTRMKDTEGRTPLHLAVSLRRLESLRLLLKEDSSVLDWLDDSRRTPLYLATELVWSAGVNEILPYSPDLAVNCTEVEETVLHLAARILVAPDELNFLRALFFHSNKHVRLMRDGKGCMGVERAVVSGNMQFVKMVMGVYPEEIGKKNNLLVLAVSSDVGDPAENLKSLIEILSVKPEDIDLALLLQTAKSGCLEYLLGLKGIDIAATSEGGQTILHQAAARGNTRAVELILARPEGRELVPIEDSNGRQAIFDAAISRSIDIVILLLKNGANLAAKDGSGRSAVDVIFSNGPQLDWMIDEVFDSFMVRSDEKDNGPAVTLDFRGLLADVKGDGRQLGVVEAVIESTQKPVIQRFFLHPIVESFLCIKWKLISILYNIIMILYISQIISVTSLSLSLYTPYVPNLVWLTRILVWCTTAPIILLEMVLVRLDLDYLIDSENWLRLGVVLCSVILSLVEAPSMRPLGAIAALLAWIELLHLRASSPREGLRILMFFEVAKNVLQVLSTFIFLLIGFSFFFLILFNGAEPFSNIWICWCKVLMMMTEMEYEDTFDQQLDSSTAIVGRIFFVVFMLLVVMVLNNLIVGMSVSDVALLEAQGKSKKLAKEARFLVTFEKLCYLDDWLDKLPSAVSTFIRKYRKVDNKITVSPIRESQLPEDLWNNVRQKLQKREEIIKGEYLYSAVNKICQKLQINVGQIEN